MKQELDSLKAEIDRLLEETGVVVFRCGPRFDDSLPGAIVWDSRNYPEPDGFIRGAQSLGVKIICCHHRTITADFMERLLSDLEGSDLPRDVKREHEREIRRLQAYEGFVSYIEVSYDFGGDTYFFICSAPWYQRLLEIMSEIDDSFDEDEGGEPGPPMGGFFSKN